VLAGFITRLDTPLSSNRHHPVSAIAPLRACYDAYDGRKPVSTARNAFFGFAKRVAILEDPTSAMKWIAACRSGSGKVQV
ncbi:DUF982 domain-containing protein, partial [Mesorhizobium sp. WSM3866]|uniref:DUF982 domain-containing protein n=1 Tax=Mesorhizobium sp. WSM3866 TaxID=422271 RepID=UPI001FE096D4